MPHDPYKALYMHIPYCVKKCDYCDFTSYALKRDHKEIDEYIESLVVQIREKARAGELAEIETVYIGGGTPSHVGASRLTSLLYALGVSLDLSACECTMEANPESITQGLVRDIYALGVNRVSLGVQSFDSGVLEILGRAHTSEQVVRAIEALQERFDNMNIDLMCGIPGQSMESLQDSLQRAINMGVPHISVYPLTIERKTKFEHAIRRGKMAPIDEDAQAQHMEAAADMLKSAGYERYEISNYAKPGFECTHNMIYWSGLPYLGLGTSAATMTQNKDRRMRVRDGVVTDDLCPRDMLAEDLMLAMRMSRGVSAARVSLADEDLLPGAQATFDELCGLELAELCEGRYVPTVRGWLCGNEMFERIFELS